MRTGTLFARSMAVFAELWAFLVGVPEICVKICSKMCLVEILELGISISAPRQTRPTHG